MGSTNISNYDNGFHREYPILLQVYTEQEQALFEGIEEISKEDALKSYKVSQFDAEFLDSVGPGIRPVYNIAALANKVS